MEKHTIFEIFIFLLFFIVLSVVFSAILVPPGAPLWVFLFLQTSIIGIAFEIAELVPAVFANICDLPKLEKLKYYPSVAILYLVCDDFVGHSFNKLSQKQTYPNVDIFILDDSKNEAIQNYLDNSEFPIIRRKNHGGFKAGNLNNWLVNFGEQYKYFLILDSDSIVSSTFIESIIMYAEHPQNKKVAIFNSLSLVWNFDGRFPRIVSALVPIRNWVRLRLANRYNGVFSSGHNNLHKTEAVLRLGGFNENFLAEDIVVTLELSKIGYTSKLVNLVAFEAEPEHIISYVKRLTRWARQTIQIQRVNLLGVSLSLKYQLFKMAWMYLSFFLYLIWIILAAWGTKSSISDLQAVVSKIIAGDPQLLASYAVPWLSVMILASIPLLIRIPLLIKNHVSIGDYLKNYLLSLSIIFFSMINVCWAQFASATNPKLTFNVTDKGSYPTTIFSILSYGWQLLPFWALLTIGFCRNPVSLVFSAPWVMLLFLNPLIIYLFHDDDPIVRCQPVQPNLNCEEGL